MVPLADPLVPPLKRNSRNYDLTKAHNTQLPMEHQAARNARPGSDAPRQYQREVAKRAIERNIIAVADTGSGKTLISVLLLKHMVAQARQEAKETGRRVPQHSFHMRTEMPSQGGRTIVDKPHGLITHCYLCIVHRLAKVILLHCQQGAPRLSTT